MSRLTKDLHTPHDDTTYAEVVKDAIDRENIVLTKLKHYEDIEEELDIDLIKAIELCKKANKQKVVYTKERWGIDTIKILDELDVELFSHRLYKTFGGIYVSWDLYEYGKTWALTKEELENETIL